MKKYPCERGTAETTAARLEQRYPAASGVRIVVDGQASQILVIAPAELQTQIEQNWAAVCADARPAAAAPAAAQPLAASGATAQQDLQLWSVPASQLEASLVQCLEGRLTPVTGATNERSAYRLALPSGEPLTITIDRQQNRVLLQGGSTAVGAAVQLVHALDHPEEATQHETGVFALNKASKADITTISTAIQANSEPPAGAPRPPVAPAPPAPAPAPAPEAGKPQPEKAAPGEGDGVVGPVQIQMLGGLDVLLIRGQKRDVQRVMDLIQQIEQLSAETKPNIQILPLAHVNSVSLAGLLRQVYGEVYASRLGSLSLTALDTPNALLLIGRDEPVATAIDLARRLDQPVAPDSQFQVYHLKHIPVESARQNLLNYFSQQSPGTTPTSGPQPQAPPGTPGQPTPSHTGQASPNGGGTGDGALAPRVQVVADFRSNSLIVHGSPRDLAEVTAMLSHLDGNVNAAMSQVRIFRLKSSLAQTLAPILQDAITGQIYGARGGVGALGAAAGAGGYGGAIGTTGSTGRPGGSSPEAERKSARLQFITVDAKGQRVLDSGILTDTQITADPRTNALIVTAAPDSMPLIAALIEDLDLPADIEAQIKVFTLINSDASGVSQTLEKIFGETKSTEGAAVPTGAASDDTVLVGLKVAVDIRTNSVIVTGSSGALNIVEALLTRLDSSDVHNRRTTVHRLRNSTALDVAQAVNDYLKDAREMIQDQQGLNASFEQSEHEAVVVAEPVSNSLIISATARFYDEILNVVKQIDQRPPMVMIQVLIAEVTLSNTDEFGVELGLQDKVLFDRSVITGSGANATASPGFQFNSNSLGNSASAASVASAHTVGGQSITNLGVGRTDSDLGLGGLVLSASSDSVSLLIRALQQEHRIQILSRPQVMTLDQQTAQILVGQSVPTIQASQLTNFGIVNSVNYRDVGLIVTVAPRVSPDRLVVMEIQAEKSKLEPTSTGIPIAITDSGETIRSPIIDTTTTRTVVSALDGQTVILGGMIATITENLQNKVPYLGSIPVVGRLFRYDYNSEKRTELLIIMTPHVIYNAQDVEAIKRVEAARMHWCLCDVMALHETDGLGKNGPSWYDGDAAVIYPDLDPTLKTMQELVPPGVGDNRAPALETIPTPVPVPPATGAAPTGPRPSPAPAKLSPPTSQAAPMNDGATLAPTTPSSAGTRVRIMPRSPAQARASRSVAPQPAGPVLSPASPSDVGQSSTDALPLPVGDGSGEDGLVPTQATTVRYFPSDSATANRPTVNR